jgi:ribosome biogenesis GTPase
LSSTNEKHEPAPTRDGLTALGWTEKLERDFEPYEQQGFRPARVATQHRGSYALHAQGSAFTAQTSGRLRYRAAEGRDLPAVGDWVAVAVEPAGSATIQAVLPRSGAFSRKVAGLETDEQIVAANVDIAFVLTSLDRDFNLRRLERYISVAYSSGANPVVVLTKTDLCDDVDEKKAAVEAVAPGVAVVAVSNLTGEGVDEVRRHLGVGTTAVMLGSSGVGKSSLVNRLLGDESQRVAGLRKDHKGRHTTTSRELLVVPGGGVVIDTPGMRELQVWDAQEGLAATFDDIESLAAECKFSDCIHESEPGCAVKAAIASGELDASRLRSYKKLLRELRAIEIKKDARAQAEERRRRMKFNRQVRAITKASPKAR